jgi:hypothetical protein
MSNVLQFPDPREEARRRAAAFQRLPPEARWRELGSLMAFGWAMVKSSPNREAIERRMAEDERRWREIQQDLFNRHGG